MSLSSIPFSYSYINFLAAQISLSHIVIAQKFLAGAGNGNASQLQNISVICNLQGHSGILLN